MALVKLASNSFEFSLFPIFATFAFCPSLNIPFTQNPSDVTTGRLIEISELVIIVRLKTTAATDDDYVAQAEMYKYVVEKYLELIPAPQRYGITVWSPTDSPEESSWRSGEPIGLWTESYYRKHAYAGVADALSGN